MFDTLITRLTSPLSPRRKYSNTIYCPAEVHSDPEDNNETLIFNATNNNNARNNANSSSGNKPRLLERRKKGRTRTENCGLRQARSLGRLDGLKEVERLVEYDRYLLLGGSRDKMVFDGRRRGRDLDRIQDMFPGDFLGLHSLEPVIHAKKSFRKKSLGDLNMLESDVAASCCKRVFLMEAPCAMSLPILQQNHQEIPQQQPNTATKSRHIFLFSDLLIIAKQKSTNNFKLKECVRVSEIWLAPPTITTTTDTTFLLGWPSTNTTTTLSSANINSNNYNNGVVPRNYLFTFGTQAARDSWWHALQHRALNTDDNDDEDSVKNEPSTTNIRIVYQQPGTSLDGVTSVECTKTVCVTRHTTIADVARLCTTNNNNNSSMNSVTHNINEGSNSRVEVFVRFGGGDGVTCWPLIGCERPHAIQLAHMRRKVCSTSRDAAEGFDLRHCSVSSIVTGDVVLELRSNGVGGGGGGGVGGVKATPKKLLNIFRKTTTTSGNNNSHNSNTTSTNTVSGGSDNRRHTTTNGGGGNFFGVPLIEICPNPASLPPPIDACLRALYNRAPHTQGIFRRCASARALRQLREKIDCYTITTKNNHHHHHYYNNQQHAIYEEITSQPALLLAALLKEFLRSLPRPILTGNVQDWLTAASTRHIARLRHLVAALPTENYTLLAHIVCVLCAICKHSTHNLMSAANLGVCIGPSLLWEASQCAPMRTLPLLVELLIEQCQTLFGTGVLTLFGGEVVTVSNDSGAEESDSLHSLGLSLDSVELSKDQKSLSRDSGLTLSSEEDRDDSPAPYSNVTFQRFDWARQAARTQQRCALNSVSTTNTSSTNHNVIIGVNASGGGGGEMVRHQWRNSTDELLFCDGRGKSGVIAEAAVPPVLPPRYHRLIAPQQQQNGVAIHMPLPIYRAPPPPPIYATAKMLMVNAVTVSDAENESYV